MFKGWVQIDIQVNVCKSLGAGADAEEMRGASRSGTNYSFDRCPVGAQRYLGSAVSVFLPNLNDVEYWGFVPNSNPALVEVDEVEGRSGDDFMRVEKVAGPDMQYDLDPRRGKGVALGHVLRFIRLIVLKKLRGYDGAPA